GTTTTRVKWSRENAHVATSVIEILAGRTGVRVESLGRDDVLRFKTGDWVELTNDSREFGGLPGEMRKVTVDDANRTMSFSPALPAADFPQGVPDSAQHFRVIRWDQSGIVRKPDGSGWTDRIVRREPRLPAGTWHPGYDEPAVGRDGA
ncbi:MAG: uncharacterized protein K0S45_4502, partial [Nitrospira sp.]|nr:uncharacterized protein [Nitrospira sp.]